MDIEETRKLVEGWLQEAREEGKWLPQLVSIVQCQLLLHIYDKLCSIDEGLSSLSSDSWDNRHER